MHAVRRRLSNSVSAARVLGCSVQTSDRAIVSDGDLLHGNIGSSASAVETLQLHIITPAAMPFMPQREYHPDYMRAPIPEEIHIPQVY